MQLLINQGSDSEIVNAHNEYCSWGDTVHYLKPARVFRNCEGSFLFDEKNTHFLDLQMWHSACNFGYKNQRLNNALKNQLDTLPQLNSQFVNPNKALLAEKICMANIKRFSEKGRVHFSVGGAQAVDDAIKLVRNHTQKSQMFAYMGGYHGRTLACSCITSSYRYRKQYGHFGERAQFVPYPYCYRCHYGKNKSDCGFYCVNQFKKLFETEYNSIIDTKTNETEFSALFAEPIQGTGGYIVPPKGYFERIKKVLDEYNILFISDEVQMGYYRTGKLWAIEHYNVVPDAITFGKSLTNGLNPLSGLWAKEKLIHPEKFPPGSTHSTFSSNPMGTRAGLEVMGLLDEVDHEKMVMAKGEKFLDGLKYLKSKYKNIGDVDGLGLALRIEITESDGITPNKNLTKQMRDEALAANIEYKGKKYGLILNIGGYYKNVFTLSPSLYITDEEIEMAIILLEQLFKRCS